MIFRFHKDFANTNFKPRFEGKDDNGKIAMIRLAVGETSVIEKEQDPNAAIRSFKTGYCNTEVDGELYYQTDIDDNDEALLSFLRKQSAYARGLIYEYDPVEANKTKAAEVKNDLQLLMELSKIKDDEALQLGYHFLKNGVFVYAKNRDYEGLRLEILSRAQEDPESVREVFKNTTKKDYLTAALAFVKGIVEEYNSGNAVVWGDNKAVIVSVTKGEEPIDALVDFYKTKEGMEVKKMIGLKLQELATESILNEDAETEKSTAKAK